jgi:mRNA interferase MazF
MKRGKVVLTPFPFTDLSGNKVRPAVIVSSDARGGADVIVAFISTVFNPTNLQPTDVLLLNNDPEFHGTGLKASSVFKMDKVATISRAILLGELGDVLPTLQARLNAKLKLALDLT